MLGTVTLHLHILECNILDGSTDSLAEHALVVVAVELYLQVLHLVTLAVNRTREV